MVISAIVYQLNSLIIGHIFAIFFGI